MNAPILLLARCSGTLNLESLNMKRKKRTETTIETHEVWILRRSGRKSQELCNTCPDYAEMLTPEEIAKLRNVSARTVYQWVEAGHPHFTELIDGRLLICLASLPAGEI